MTIFLAFIIFSELLTTAPVIVGAYRKLDDCATEARRLNKELEDKHLPDSDSGFVCLQLRGNT